LSCHAVSTRTYAPRVARERCRVWCGDRAIGRTAQVREGDEPSSQRVRGERAALQSRPADRGLDQVAYRLGVQGAVQDSVTPADLAEHRPVGDAGGIHPGLHRGDRAVRPAPDAGEHDELVLLAALVRFRSRQGEDQPAVVRADLLDQEVRGLGTAQRGEEPDQQQRPVPLPVAVPGVAFPRTAEATESNAERGSSSWLGYPGTSRPPPRPDRPWIPGESPG
jgi:hypothetical protein